MVNRNTRLNRESEADYISAAMTSTRANINSRRSKYNLEKWIQDNIKTFDGMKILDLGCGNGKQIFFMARIVHNASIIGIDISEELLKAVRERAKKTDIEEIKTICTSIDNIYEVLTPKKFDLIISSYAIYYSKDMEKLIKKMKTLLSDQGQIFICGPGKGTNNEIITILKKFVDRRKIIQKAKSDFISKNKINEIVKDYKEHKIIRLNNKIRFFNSEEVLGWWSNHISYVPEIKDVFLEYMENWFEDNERFELTKNVLGVHLENPIF